MHAKLCAALVAAVACGAAGAAGYPAKPVRVVTTFAPGGGADIIARAIGGRLQETLGASFVIDNRAGAGGVIGSALVAKAAPDGHTLLFGSNGGLILNPLMNPRVPYDPFRDFAPVSLLVVSPQLLVLGPSVPAASVRELVALLKARPGALTYASVGQGSTTHLGMELFKSMTGTSAVHVPYKGSGPAVNDLFAGEVHFMFSNMPAMLPHVRAQRLKGIAVSSSRRTAAAPDIPTVAESGVPGFESVSWFGLFAPAHTPREIVAVLNRHVVAALKDAALASRLAAGGADPSPGSPEGLRDYMRSEHERWRKVVAAAKLGGG